MCVPWGGTRNLLWSCTIVFWPLRPNLCISSLPWLATVWTQGRRQGKAFVPRSPQVLLLSFSFSMVSSSLLHYGLQHARLPCLHYLPEFAQTHVHWVGDAIQPSHPLSLPFLLPSIFLSIRDFSNESAFHIRSNIWALACPSSEWIFRMNFF